MSEHTWLAILSALVAITVFLLGTLIVGLRNFKLEFKTQFQEYCSKHDLVHKDVDAKNDKDHDDIWDRVNHHWHNGGGNVVIPTGVQKRG